MYPNANSTMSGSISGQINEAKIDPMTRFFASHHSEISIAQTAIDEATRSTKALMDRMGIPSMYGCAVLGGEIPVDASGEIDRVQRAMSALTDTARELRGLCETLDAKL